MTFRACVVAAVSTPGQVKNRKTNREKASIPEQLHDCQSVCEARDWKVVETITIPGHSRNYTWLHELIADCPPYAHLIRLVASGEVDLLVVRHYDRLWSNSTLQGQVSGFCREHRVQIYSINQPKEPVPPELIPRRPGLDGLQETFSGVVRDEELTIKVARWRVGMKDRIAAGLHGGYGLIPYGYARAKEGPMLVDPSRARWVVWIYERRRDGWGFRRIAWALRDQSAPAPTSRPWGEHEVRYILRNSAYVGEASWGGAHGPGAHEAIITHDLWAAVRAMDGLRASHAIKPGKQHILAGLATCGYCGWRMGYSRVYGRWRLVCNRYKHSLARECVCNSHTAPDIEAGVMQAVREALANPAAYQDADADAPDHQGELAALESEEKRLQERYARWNDLYESGAISATELMTHRARLSGEVNRIAAQRREIEQYAARRVARAERRVALSEVVGVLDAKSADELREIYGQLIERIMLKRGEEPVIYWL